MFGTTMTMEDMKYLMEAQERMADRVIDAIKKYWKENSKMICMGLMTMSGNTYLPMNRN